MRALLRRFRYHLAVFFAVVGPGFVAAVVDNDAGGIYTYSSAGARFGYLPLWTLLPITLLLIITLEMGLRMGAVTGKGLADLIREEFGLRATFGIMAVLVTVNLANVMAEFAGIASSLELFRVSRYFSVPLSAAAVWLLVVKGNYRGVAKIFLIACILYAAYAIAGFLVKPHWKEAALDSVRPVLLLEPAYIYMLIGMLGATIAPWMQFYLQGLVVEKGITAKEYAESRIEVTVGCVLTAAVAFFIIVASAGSIYSVRPREIQDAGEAALGLKPFGEYAAVLFGALLFNASIFSACILPLATADSVCEGLGFESGAGRRLGEAPIFYFLYTSLIVVGAAVVLIPGVPLVRMILLSQALNGALLPCVLIFMILLINKRELMGEWTNPRWFNLFAWLAVMVIIGLTLAYVGILVRGMPG